MAAQVSAHARFAVRAVRAGIEDAVRASLACARPSLEELLSLWPVGLHPRIVLWAKLGADGALSTGAHMREHAFEGSSADLAREVRRIRDDVPVVLEVDKVGRVVVPMGALRASR